MMWGILIVSYRLFVFANCTGNWSAITRLTQSVRISHYMKFSGFQASVVQMTVLWVILCVWQRVCVRRTCCLHEQIRFRRKHVPPKHRDKLIFLYVFKTQKTSVRLRDLSGGGGDKKRCSIRGDYSQTEQYVSFTYKIKSNRFEKYFK